MKQIFKYAMALLMLAAVVSCGRDDAPAGKNGVNGINGKDGRDGKNGTDGTKIHSGTGTPAESLGNVGDFYLDINTRNLYGPKTAQGWGKPVSLKGNDGKNGNDGQDGSKIYSGNTAPDPNIGKDGDWYIDTTNKKLYGPKTTNGWGEGISLGGGNTTSLRGDYILSKDGSTLLAWLNKEMSVIDMESDPELRNVKVLGKAVFEAYPYLERIILPNGLKKIGDFAFRHSNLTEIVIPNEVEIIGKGAFAGNENPNLHGNITSVTLGEKIKVIGNSAFINNKLTKVNIPNSVTDIGDFSFKGNQLNSINIGNKVINIGQEAFIKNKLTSINIPNSVKNIGESAFKENLLSSITIGNSVVNIGKYAFTGNQLTSIIIPDSVLNIGDFSFYMNQLNSITIGNKVENIGWGAFRTNKLTSITIPSSVTSIKRDAFKSNPIESFTLDTIIPPAIEKLTYIIDNYYLRFIYVPTQSVDAYKQAEGWKSFGSIIRPKH